MSTTASQGLLGRAEGGVGGGGSATKPPMSSQKSGRSGTIPGPLSGQKKTTLGNGVSLPRKPARSVYVLVCLSHNVESDVYLEKNITFCVWEELQRTFSAF